MSCLLFVYPSYFFFFFFFQEKAGIRDVAVTGVQTCALPISGERLTKKPQKPPGPRECLGEKALHGPITATWTRPAGEAQHRHTSRQDQQSRNNTAALPESCSGHSGLEALQKGYNVPGGFLEVLSCRCGRPQLYEPPEALSS